MRLLSTVLAFALLLPVGLRAQSGAPANNSDEQQIFSLLNRERTSRGLRALVWNESLAEAARQHSAAMIDHGALSHQFDGEPDPERRIAAVHVSYTQLGENVALAPDAGTAHDSLMHSPHHRANILDAGFNAVGIGVLRDGDEIYVTQDFAKTVAELSVAEARASVLKQLNALRAKAGAMPLRLVAFDADSEDSRQQSVCEMAKVDRASVAAAKLPPYDGLTEAVALAFETSDIEQIGQQMRSLAKMTARSAAIDLCQAPSATNPAPVWWGVVTLYK
jgi:uncharacterized protein YkwD